MLKLFSLTDRHLFSLFVALIAFNVHILATNDSNDNQISELSNQLSEDSDFGEIDISDNESTPSDTGEPPDDNQTLALLSTVPQLNRESENSTGSESETGAQPKATHDMKVNCTPVNIDVATNQSLETNSSVILVNVSKLMEYLESKPNISQTVGANCTLVMFYYKWCPFSAKYAKHYNALGRVYPQFNVLAIDAYGLNRYGLVGVPSILFFHNGKIVGKLNDSNPTIEGFVSYIQQLTSLSPVMSTDLIEDDLIGPLLSSPEPRFDYLLLMAWIFTAICLFYLFGKSNLFKTTIEAVRNNWREAEAQHEHMD